MNQSSGFCGEVSYLDARAWGPPTWRALHVFAENFPADPNNATIAACENMTAALPWMLPQHGASFQQTLGDPKQACVNQSTLVHAFVDAHNQHTTLDPWTVPQAHLEYGNWSQCLTDDQWGNKQVCRDKVSGQTCVENRYCTGCTPWVGEFVEKGYCGTMWTANPRLFGPWVWKMLHIMGVWYADTPTQQAQDACHSFVHALPLMLPCDHCGYHLNETIQNYTKTICTSSDALHSFLVHAHNRVSENVHPDRANYTDDDARQEYISTQMCLHNELGAANNLDRGVTAFRTKEDDEESWVYYALTLGSVTVVLVALSLRTKAAKTKSQEYRTPQPQDTGIEMTGRNPQGGDLLPRKEFGLVF